MYCLLNLKIRCCSTDRLSVVNGLLPPLPYMVRLSSQWSREVRGMSGHSSRLLSGYKKQSEQTRVEPLWRTVFGKAPDRQDSSHSTHSYLKKGKDMQVAICPSDHMGCQRHLYKQDASPILESPRTHTRQETRENCLKWSTLADVRIRII